MGKIWCAKDTYLSELTELEVLESVGVAMQMIGTTLAFIGLLGAASYGIYRLWMVGNSIYRE